MTFIHRRPTTDSRSVDNAARHQHPVWADSAPMSRRFVGCPTIHSAYYYRYYLLTLRSRNRGTKNCAHPS